MVPAVSPVKVVVSALDPTVLSTQAMLVSVPPHVPLKTCKTASERVLGVTVTIWEVVVATKLYQTSSSAVPRHPDCDWVAFTEVPAIVEVHVKVRFTVSAMAPEQLSFAVVANVVPVPTRGPVVVYVGPPVQPVLLYP